MLKGARQVVVKVLLKTKEFSQPGRHQAGWFLCKNRNVMVPENAPSDT